MNITDIFIRRPVLSLVLSFLILIAGLQAVRSVNIRQFPHTQNASVVVRTVYVGANAELVRGFITTPLERAIASADGIEYMQSQSAQGFSNIKIRLKLNYDPIKALAEISTKVDQVRQDLPPEAEVPTINIQSAESEFAAAYLSFQSDILDQNQITDYLIRIVQPRLSTIEGMQKAEILGDRTFAMRIWLKPDRMAAFNISPAHVRQVLASNNYLAAVGQTKGSHIQVNLTANTDLHTVSEFKKLVILEDGGSIVRIEDIAEVSLGAQDYESSVRLSGQTAVFMAMYPLPNANTLDVIAEVRKEMEEIIRDLPSGLNGRIAYDATEYIESAISEVLITLTETLIIVIFVIFLFLGSYRSILIPIVAIPLSLIGAVFMMQVLGFTINLLTLLAIVLSVGMVVDDAIVVVENVERHLAMGKSPTQAAMLGARELVGPIIAMTITLAAVYAPIGLQGGLTGSLFREFAFTLSGAVIISGVVALTLSPMMASKMLKANTEQSGFSKKINANFEYIRATYTRLLDVTLGCRPAVYIVWIGLTVLTIPMFSMSPAELAPVEDEGAIFTIIDAPANSAIELTDHYMAAATRILQTIPETDFTFEVVFPTGGIGGLITRPWGERTRKTADILAEVQQGLRTIPGIRVMAITPPPLPGGGEFPVEIVLTSTAEPEELLVYAQQLKTKAIESHMFAFPPLIDVKMDQPQSELIIDRDKVAYLGLNLQQVGYDVASMLGGNYVNRFNIAGRSYKVIPQISRANRLNPDQLQDMYITGPEGQLIPLGTVAEVKNTTVARSLNRFQQLNAVKISGVAIRPLDEALKFLEKEAEKILPPGTNIDYTGESRQLRTEGSKFLQSFGLAMVLIFLVLAAQFNSFRDPFVILAGSVPLAMFGALVFVFLKMPGPQVPFFTNGWTTTFNIYSQVGMVTLIGLVSKNGILIVEFANKMQAEGMSKLEAVRQAAQTRLRPILMISASTIAGHFPLTLVSGPGASARNSIGLVLVGGMAIGSLFTLFVIPSIYMLIARDHSKDRHAELKSRV